MSRVFNAVDIPPNAVAISNFVNYVKTNGKYISVERDHGGPGQGTYMDDGITSFKEDCKYMDIIHIDPWKKYQKFEEGLKWTIELLNFCYDINPNLYFLSICYTDMGILMYSKMIIIMVMLYPFLYFLSLNYNMPTIKLLILLSI